jgi:thiol-disulfide isomerase/thioredoxin
LKSILIVLTFFGASACLFGQADSSDNYVERFRKIPGFKIHVVPDSSVYSSAQIKKNSPFVLMFFSPSCDHCQQQTKELLAYKEELKNIPVLMVSSAPFNEVKDFYEGYGLSSLPNIIMGQDIRYALWTIYKLKTFPSVFVYDNRGILAKAFVGNIGIPAILDAVK